MLVSANVGFATSHLAKCPRSPITVYGGPDGWNNCVGTTVRPNGEKYVGEWKNDRRHGYGTFTSKKEKYTGTWRHGIEFRGTKTWSDGTSYAGEWQNGLFHGQGAFTYSSGRILEGVWAKGSIIFEKKIDRLNVSKPQWQRNGLLAEAFNYLSQFERRNLQNRLKDIGYYSSKVDGQYGPRTQRSLEQFNKNGMNFNLALRGDVEKLIDQALALKKDTTCEMDLQICSEADANQAEIVANASEAESSDGVEQDEVVSVSKYAVAQEATSKDQEINDIKITPEQILNVFEEQDYQAALLGAQYLAPTGDPTAQYVLGRMYADGLGVLQQFKLGHMWLNLASLNGSREAAERRNQLQAQMPFDATVEAQAMALNCMQSNYSKCGLPAVASKPDDKKPALAHAPLLMSDIKQYFQSAPVLRRKQLQYALKELGLYASSIDAKWGKGTQAAISNFIKLNDEEFTGANHLIGTVISKVNVPNKFAATPARKTTSVQLSPSKTMPKASSFSVPAGWRTISNNMTHSFVQADSICKPQSRNAGRGVRAAPMIGGPSFNCDQFGTGFNCNSDPTGMQGFANTMAQIGARRDAYDSCMAQYGWKSTKARGLFGG